MGHFVFFFKVYQLLALVLTNMDYSISHKTPKWIQWDLTYDTRDRGECNFNK